MNSSSGINLRKALRFGLIAGLVALLESAIGIVTLFGERSLVVGLITMGQVLLFAPTMLLAFSGARKNGASLRETILNGALTGLVSGLPLVALILLATSFNLRQFMPNVSPALIELLTFHQSPQVGSLLLMIAMAAVGAISAYFSTIPALTRKAISSALLWTLGIGLFSEILSIRLRDFFGVGFTGLIFTRRALQPWSAAIIFALVVFLTFWSVRRKQQTAAIMIELTEEQKNRRRWIQFGAIFIALVVLPFLSGSYLSEVINNVGIFVLMGLGLNIVVGFAGLLDLGYVAFFAIGAYSMAVLTSTGPLGVGGLSFWVALPFCVMIAACAGLLLGVPVLRMRGDYLAIVTLGFGEIIRILALSDLLKPFIGGAQGVLKIPKPPFGSMALVKPEQFYFVVLGGCLLALFISWRLSESRLGRQWRAMREDEDVAEAVGINLVRTKLLAFSVGAAFSGMAGALFASKLTSIFPHSFKLEISINVLALIIIGGLGSLPGVIAGAIVLVGLPELLREFAEYRLLMYGVLLVVMMLARPEGLIPSAVRRREMLSAEEQIALAKAEAGGSQ